MARPSIVPEILEKLEPWLEARMAEWKLLQPKKTNPQYMCIDFGVSDRNSKWLKVIDKFRGSRYR